MTSIAKPDGIQNFFPDFPTYIGTPKKNLGEKPNVKLTRRGIAVHLLLGALVCLFVVFITGIWSEQWAAAYMQKDDEKHSCSFVAWGGCLPAQTHVRLCHPNRLCAFSNSSSSHVHAYAHSLVHPVLCSRVTWARDFWCTKCTEGEGVTDLGLS